MFERLKKLAKFPPSGKTAPVQEESRSRLEFLFTTREGSAEIRKLLQRQKDRTALATLTLSVTILGYAGHHAAGILKAIEKLANTGQRKEFEKLPQRLKSEFDTVFVETVALCFYMVMHRFWDGDDGNFCVADDLNDANTVIESDYLESLMGTLDFADEIVSDASSKTPRTYLRSRALSYEEEPDATDHANDWFAVNVVKPIFPDPEPAAFPLAAICMAAADEIRPDKLDALCRLAWAGAPL